MPRQETIDRVPDSEVARVKAQFEADGATVVITSNGDGTSKIVATYPDHQETIEKVPDSEVARVKAQFEANGATVVVTDNNDGTSTVVATFSD